eukprot:TRINITY_DN9052_c0_g3_i1.p1 TRINITY_DN9052_c0_g3~~TRINITY_DN9052_c0_g3_i1.p1  ORF type:complete len:661 (-),score=134.78 TRINITY_DN9052_c0_g3_i1:43-2025(-)
MQSMFWKWFGSFGGGSEIPNTNRVVASFLYAVLSLRLQCSLGEFVGVSPERAHLYTAAKDGGFFKCLGSLGTEVEIPGQFVNDNFCDCADGLDEPGTAACAGVSGAIFYCKNLGSIPKQIYASRVNDGICDCCDGSDEQGLQKRALEPSCRNSCETEGEYFRTQQEEMRQSVSKGLQVKAEVEGKAALEIEGWRAENERLKQNISELQAAVAAAEKQEQELKESNEKRVVERLLFSEDFEDLTDFARDWKPVRDGSVRLKPSEALDRGQVLAFDSCTWGGDIFSTRSFNCSSQDKCRISFRASGALWQGFSVGTSQTVDDAHSWLAVPRSNPDFKDRLVSLKVARKWRYYEYEVPANDGFQMFGSSEVSFATKPVHIMMQAHASTAHCSETMVDDIRVWKRMTAESKQTMPAGRRRRRGGRKMKRKQRSGKTGKAGRSGKKGKAGKTKQLQEETTKKKLEKQEPEVSEYARWALERENVQVQKAETDIDVEKASDHDSSKTADPQDSSESLGDLRSALRKAKGRSFALDKKLRHVEMDSSWFPLVDACVSKPIDNYSYNICYFGSAKQGSVSLGSFDAVDPKDPNLLLFSGGQQCHGGPRRSLKLRLVCGGEEHIEDIAEPSRCTYLATVRHPKACKEEDLQFLDLPLEKRLLEPHHDEL